MVISRRAQQFCVWCGPGMAVLFGIGFLVADFIPPPSPDLSAEEMAALYQDNTAAIRIGLILTAIASALLGPYFAVITVQMRRMEGTRPALAYTQLALGALAIIEFIFPVMIMQGATFRQDRDPDIILALNDISWIMFLGVVSTFILQLIVFGVAILSDQRTEPIIPRWVGYFNIWMAMTFTPGNILVFFKTGPFAWDGFFIWWLPFISFMFWFPINVIYLLKAVKMDDYEPATPSPEPDMWRELDSMRAELRALRSEQART